MFVFFFFKWKGIEVGKKWSVFWSADGLCWQGPRQGMWGPSPPPCLNMYVEALSEHTHREAFRPSFSPESPLPWLCGCFWNLSKQKPPGYYWPSLEVELCPFFLELSMTALPLQLLCDFEIPIITEGRADLFSLLLCRPIVRMHLLSWRASRTREMICSFENPSGGVPYADEKAGRELTAGTSTLYCASRNVCFSLKHARLSWARWGTLVCRVSMGSESWCWRSSSLWGMEWNPGLWLFQAPLVRGWVGVGGVCQTRLLCALREFCNPGNQARGHFVLFRVRSKVSMFRGCDLMRGCMWMLYNI